MLPNWLLGKSKSKLQEILGGGGGTAYTAGDGIDISSGVISFDPSTMDAIPQSKVTNLGDDLAGLAPKTAISNPNILHNPWFTVNQRGVSSVNTGGAFIADRWKVASEIPNFLVTRTSDGYLDVDNSEATSSYTAIYQKRTTKYINSLDGMKITASVMFSDGSIKSGTVTFDHTTNKNYYSDDEISLGYSSPTILGLNVKAGHHLTIKALKLEVGELSTLHLDPRPEYAVELAKCQRYFQRLMNESAGRQNIGIAIATSATSARWIVALPANMRTEPTLSASLIGLNDPSDTSYQSSSVALQQVRGNQAAIGINVASGLTAGKMYLVQHWENTSAIDFNAELSGIGKGGVLHHVNY